MVLKQLNNQGGYTMFELLVSLVIIIIMSSLVVFQLQVRDEEKVNIATEDIATALRRVRNLATSRIVDSSGNYPVGGYGFSFLFDEDAEHMSTYTIFTDDNNNHAYNPGVDTDIEQYFFADNKIRVWPSESEDTYSFYIIFQNEREIYSNLAVSAASNSYSLDVNYMGITYNGVVEVYDLGLDGKAWGNIRVSYEN